jgi:hypothetical protein
MKPGSTADFLHPRWAAAFAVLALLWLVHWYLPVSDAPAYRRFTRIAGYLATLAMLVPYLHILRRFFRYRYWGHMTRWLQWHAGTAYLAFLLTLLHCRGRGNGTLTIAIVLLLWAVMLSGVLGFFGLKMLYRIMTLAVKRELGLERLEAERARLADRAVLLIDDYSLLAAAPTRLTDGSVLPADVRNWAALVAAVSDAKTPLGKMVAPTITGNDKKCFEALRKDPDDEVAQAELVAMLNGVILSGKGRQVKFTRECLSEGTVVSPELENLVKDMERERTPAEQKRQNRLFLEALAPGMFEPSPRLEEAVERFFSAAGMYYLRPGFAGSSALDWLRALTGQLPSVRAGGAARPAGWRWMFSRAALDRAAGGYWQRAREVASGRQRAIVDELWAMMDSRRQMNVEYWFHRLARLWLLVHGPAAAALFVLIALHIGTSIWYGGF